MALVVDESTTAPLAVALAGWAERPGVWMFAGYGTHWGGMGRVLLRREAAFAAAVDRLDPHFVAYLGWGLRAGLESDEPLTVARAQPLTFGVQLALAALWRAHGARPAAVLGHSMGEVAAAVVAGALSVEDGVRVISLRARLLAEAGPGAMAVVELAEEDFTEVAEDLSSLHIAVIGGPRQLVVTGPADEVAEFADRVTALGGLAHTLTAEGAGHCPAVDPLLPRLLDGLDGLRPGEAVMPFYSTAAPDMRPEDPLDAHYWMANLRNTVRLSDAVHAAARDGHRFFLEISPHPVLGQPVTATLGNAGVRDPLVVASTIRGSDEAFHRNLAVLHANGLPPAAAPALLDSLVTVGWAPAAAPRARFARPTCLLGGADDALLRAAAAHPAAPSGTRTSGSGRVPDDILRTTTHLVFIVAPTGAEPDPHAAQRSAHGIADLVRSVLSHSGLSHSGPAISGQAGRGHRVWLVTRGAAGVRPGEPAHPDGAWIRGTVRCLALEQPRLRATWLDLDDDTPADAATLWAELAADDPADEIAWRGGNRHTARLITVPAAEPRTAQAVSAGAAYLVTGGFRGIGLELARWLAQRRAGRIVLVGRTGATPESRKILDDLRGSGTDLVEARGDLTDPGKTTHLVRAARAGGLRLAGIVHGATASHDWPASHGRPAGEVGAGELRKVWTPQAHGGWLLHRALMAAGAAAELDWWVSLSSTAALLGSPGRSAEAGADAWLGAFASWQLAQGLPAWSVSWDPWARPGDAKDVSPGGSAPIRPDEAVATLDALLRREPNSVGVLPPAAPVA